MAGKRKFYNDEELLAILMNSDEEIFDEDNMSTSDEDEISETEADLEAPTNENDLDVPETEDNSQGKKNRLCNIYQ